MLLPWLTLFDFRGILANFIEPNKINHNWKYDDFVIIVPIFNDIKYLTNIDFLKKYKGKVVLCTTDVETEKFYKEIQKIANENSFKIIKCPFKKESKNPWKLYQKTLLAHDYVLGESVKILNSKYVIFLDADTICKTDLAYLSGFMEKKQLDLASVKVVPSKKETIAENIQSIEYEIAMKSRRIYPWLTSGAAMIAKRESMIEIMKDHSLFFNGGDIEIGKIANLKGLKIDHIPVTFYTDVPETFPKLFKQRFSWFCGAFRHSVINAHTNLFSPIYALYFTIVIFLMLPLKVYELVANWFILPFLFLFYMIVCFISNWEIKNKYMFIFPLYSLFQVLVLPVCGIYRYIKTVITTKNVGLIKVFYKHKYSPTKYVLNILFILGISALIFNLHLVDRTLLLSNIDLFELIGLNFQSKNWLSTIYEGVKLLVVLLGTFLILMGLVKAGFYIKKISKKSNSFFSYLFSLIK